MADDPSFEKLPARDLLHRWWVAHSQGSPSPLADLDKLLDCLSEADTAIKDQTHPLGDKPLVDVNAGNLPPVPPAMAEKQASKYQSCKQDFCHSQAKASNSRQRTVVISLSSRDLT
jgi:hypothetical protein